MVCTILLADDFMENIGAINDIELVDCYDHLFRWVENLEYSNFVNLQSYLSEQFEDFAHMLVFYVAKDDTIYIIQQMSDVGKMTVIHNFALLLTTILLPCIVTHRKVNMYTFNKQFKIRDNKLVNDDMHITLDIGFDVYDTEQMTFDVICNLSDTTIRYEYLNDVLDAMDNYVFAINYFGMTVDGAPFNANMTGKKVMFEYNGNEYQVNNFHSMAELGKTVKGDLANV